MNHKYSIKIPSDTKILYSEEKKMIVIIGALKRKSLILKLKLQLLPLKKRVIITPVPFKSIANNEKKNIKLLQGTTVALIKQALIETSSLLCQKLKFIGVGYRAFSVENYENQLLLFKLGYSHSIYFAISSTLKMSCLKLTKLFIFGNSYQEITQTATIIRHFRKPEPYKGKGVLYENEKIKLKEGKKI